MKRFAFFVLLLTVISPLFAGQIDISLAPADWSEKTVYQPYTASQTPDGYLRVTCNTTRGRVHLKSNVHFNLQGAILRYKWRINNYGLYGATGDGMGGVSRFAPYGFTTHHSWANSKVISDNTWIYTEVIVNPDHTWSYDYSYSDYGSGGIYHVQATASDALWTALADSYLHKYMVDCYSPSAYFEIAEAYVITPGPSVDIITPADESFYEPNEPVNFLATVSDTAEPFDYSWASDLDGAIGDSNMITVSDLSLGSHTVTVTATSVNDPNESAQADVEVHIIESPLINPISHITVSESGSYTGPVPVLSQGSLFTTWTLEEAPAGMTIDPATGQVTWGVPVTAGSPFTVRIRAENPVGFDEISWQVDVIKTPSFATTVWSDIQDGEHGEDGHDAFSKTAFDHEGNIIAAGYIDSSLGMKDAAFLVKYSPTGDVLWSKTVDVPNASGKVEFNDRFSDVDVDSENNIIVVGTKSGTFSYSGVGNYHTAWWVQKYTPDGQTLMWEIAWEENSGSAWHSANGVYVDALDNIYVTGSSFERWGGAEHKWVTFKYDKDGNVLLGPISHNWVNTINLQDYAFDVIADSNQDIFIVGHFGVYPNTTDAAIKNFDMHVRKLNGITGVTIWNDTFSGSTNRADYGRGLAIDPDGNILAVGGTNKNTTNSPTDYDWLMIKYDNATGNRLWEQTYESRPGASEFCYDAVSDANGDFYVCGYKQNESSVLQRRIAKISGIDGATLAETVWPSEYNSYLIGLDISDHLIAASGMVNNGSDNDVFVTLLTVEFALQITDPNANSVFEYGQPVNLAAELVGGAEPPYYFTWTSSLVGVLGTGQQLQTSDLSLGQHLITCRLDYGDSQSMQSTVRIDIVSAPEIEPLADVTIADGAAYTGPMPVVNEGAGEVMWSLAEGPDGMTIEPATGVVTWNTPIANPAGYAITLEAANVVNSDQVSYTLTVLETPEIEQIDNAIILYGGSYTSVEPVLLAGTLPVTWELLAGPDDMTINLDTGQLTWPSATIEGVNIIRIRAANAAASDEMQFTLTAMRPPVLTDLSDAVVKLHTAYSRSVSLLQGTGPVTWQLTDRPAGLTISSGSIQWADPMPKDATFTVTVTATNAVGTDTKSYNLTVLESPVIESIDNITVHEGAPLNLQAALNAGSLPVKWRLLSAPAGVSINPDTGDISWTKAFGQYSPYTVTLQAQNAVGTSQASFVITVLRPPIIMGIADTATAEGGSYTSVRPGLYQGTAPIAWSLISGPAGMTVDPATGIATWANVVYRETPYPVEIRAENVVSSDTENWLLRVIQAPIIAPIHNTQAADNAAFNGPVPVLNQGTEVTWSLIAAPSGMTINSRTGQVRWTSPADSGMPETVTVQAANIAGTAQQTFTVDVLASPLISPIAQQAAQEYSPYTGPIPTLIKGDGAIIWSLVNGPTGLTINPVTGVVTWNKPVAKSGLNTITIKAQNTVGYDVTTWHLDVPMGYTAMVTADLISAPAGTPVDLTGSVTWLQQSAPQVEVPVDIDIHVQGTTRTIRVMTDAAGQFATVFHPLPNEAGMYEIVAVHPLAAGADAQDGFQLYALMAEPDKAYHSLKPGQVIEGQFTISNPGDLPLSNIAATVFGAAENLQLNLDVPTELEGLAEAVVQYSLTATDSTVQNDVFEVELATTEGATANMQFNVKVIPLAYDVRIWPESLSAGMVRGDNRLVQFEVYNVGGAASEPLQVLIPPADWLALSSPQVIGAIEPNDVKLVSLQLTPDETLPLGMYSGEIVVYGGGIVKHVPFEFNCVSDAVGDLQITVVDEFTYYAEGSPNVEGARITLIDSITGDLAAVATTDVTGVVIFNDLPEAHYEVIIDEVDHGSYRNVHSVAPGVVNRITAFMPRNLVKYQWTVTETEIEDHYELVLDTVFETSVPAPVVTIEPAKIDLAEMEDGEMHVDFVITNHGLVSAENAFLRFDQNDQYEVELLSDYYGEIKPKQVIVVPAVIRDTYYVEPDMAAMSMQMAMETSDSSDCNSNFKGKVYYRLVCGDDGKWKTVPVHVGFWTCPNDTPPSRPTNPPGKPGDPVPPSPEDDEEKEKGGGGSGKTPLSKPNSGGGGGGGGGGSSPDAPYITFGMVAGDIVGTQCDPCPGKQFEAFASCAISFLPLNCPMTVLKSAWDIASACTSNDVFSFNCLNTVVGGILGSAGNCLKDAGGLSPIGLAYNILNCLYGIATACDNQNAAAFAAGVSQLESLTGQTFSDLPMNDETTELLYQQAQQLEKMMDGLTVVFGDPIWFSGTDVDGVIFEDLMNAVTLATDEAGPMGQHISDLEQAELLTLPLPNQMDTSHIHAFCDRWNRSLDYWEAGKFTTADLEAGDNPDFIDAGVLQQKSAEASEAAQAAMDQGFESMFDGAYYAQQEFYASVNQGSEGICAKVKVQIKQDAVMTRTAFNASLELDNESDGSIDNVLVEVKITDEAGGDVTDLFGIYPPSLSGISAINGTDSLLAGSQARAEWIILPTNEAAPHAEKTFYVGATLTYDIDGLEVLVPIYPDQITVKPEAQLSIQYFHQKDVYSDDPYTDDVEPAEPYSLGMMVTNTGAGAARNVQITSAQPQIIRHEDDKDILIDFEIIDAELNGHDLPDSLTVNMGDIAPGGKTVARWQMISSLQGRFTSYKASFEHINGLGDPRLSLIQQVDIHELIHCVRVDMPSDDGIVDFLVNDLSDANALPETLYTSTGSIAPVQSILIAQTDGIATEDNLQVQLTIPASAGHVYIQLDNPAEEGLVLASVVRSDGKVLLPEYNAWTTDRMMRPQDEPHYRQRRLHLFDTDSTGIYTVTYTTIQYPLGIDHVAFKSDPVATVDVTFDVPVDPTTLDWTDVELTRDYGVNLITYPISIRPLSETTFRFSGLAFLTAPAGRYELRIKTEGVQSADGIAGASVYASVWYRTLTPWNVKPDNIVNFEDFSAVAAKWNETGCHAPIWCEGADINRDGNVNLQDVIVQCQYWLENMD